MGERVLHPDLLGCGVLLLPLELRPYYLLPLLDGLGRGGEPPYGEVGVALGPDVPDGARVGSRKICSMRLVITLVSPARMARFGPFQGLDDCTASDT